MAVKVETVRAADLQHGDLLVTESYGRPFVVELTVPAGGLQRGLGVLVGSDEVRLNDWDNAYVSWVNEDAKVQRLVVT